MRKKVAFLINPFKRIQLQSYVDWVKSCVDFSLIIFDQEWPKRLNDFDEVWVMGGDGTFNYFVNKYSNCDKPIALFNIDYIFTVNEEYRTKIIAELGKSDNVVLSLKQQVIEGNIYSNLISLSGDASATKEEEFYILEIDNQTF